MSDGSSDTWQTLASVLAGGLAGYVDAQNSQPVTVQQPLPQTAYGYAGTGQSSVAAKATFPTWVPYAALALAAIFLLRK